MKAVVAMAVSAVVVYHCVSMVTRSTIRWFLVRPIGPMPTGMGSVVVCPFGPKVRTHPSHADVSSKMTSSEQI